MCQTFDVNLSPLPRPLTLASMQGKWWQTVKSKHLQSLFALDPWPTPLNCNPSLAANQCQGRPRAKIKVVGQTVWLWERLHTDGWTLPNLLSPCFAKVMQSIIILVVSNWIISQQTLPLNLYGLSTPTQSGLFIQPCRLGIFIFTQCAGSGQILFHTPQ